MGKYFIILLFIMLLGCQKEECRVSDVVPIGFVTTVCDVDEERDDDYAPETRTSYPANGSTASFASGDNIGVTETATTKGNIRYTYNGTLWNTSTNMYWKDGTTTHTFYAYYPYNAASTANTAVIPLLNNQVVTTVPDASSDLLVSGPKTQKRNDPTNGTNVPLTFTHAFSLLQFNVKRGSSLYVLDNITIQAGNTSGGSNRYGIINTVNGVSQIWYNHMTQAIEAVANTSAIYSTTLSRDFASFSLLPTATPFYFFVMPGTYANPVPAVKLSLKLLGLVKLTNFTPLNTTTFNPNTKYSYDVQLGLLRSAAPEITIKLVSSEPIATGDSPKN